MAESFEILPFGVEYAKSGRASCKGCKLGIDKETLRMAIMVQSPMFDGKVPHWYHFGCFWKKSKISNVGDVKGFADLRWEDQEKLRLKIEAGEGGSGVNEYATEYAKSNRSKCKQCELPISKGTVRVSKKDMQDMRYAGKPTDHWHHVACMAQILLANSLSTEEIDGFEALKADDQTMLIAELKLSKKRKSAKDDESGDASNSKKSKKDDKDDSDDEKMKKQTKMLWALKDGLKDMKSTAIKEFLEVNDQHIPSGEKRLIALVADLLMFGSLEKCPECGGNLTYKEDSYHCTGDVNAWTKCLYNTQKPGRKALDIPEEYKEQFVVMKKYKFVKRSRMFPVSESTAKLISKQNSDISSPQSSQSSTSSLKSTGKSSQSSKSSSFKSGEKTQKLKLKGGAAVDPDSGLTDSTHVYKSGKDLYSVVLGLVNVVTGTNSYYKLQLLESDEEKKKRYWVYRSWGRVGTTIGNNKVEKMEDKEEAKEHFEGLYSEKTGNEWDERDKFEKRPNKFYPLEMDYGDSAEGLKKLESTGSSKLAKPVQELIKMIFDVDAMKKAMMEFELDLEKMPLGKLSKKHIESAYAVVSEAQQLIESGSGTETQFIDISNRFYTLIPHDFGMDRPPLLKDQELIKEKLDMLDSLLEMEIAYNLLKDDGETEKDPIDHHYEKLKANLEVISKDSVEFQHIEKYTKNTHAATHQDYTLEIEHVYATTRQGEKKKYKPFKSLPNRMLLWHGSRITNYGGILSQGLRIAPPEAPVTGYMFGKGVYFADMVSKSANYCHTKSSAPTGLLLLCEVALGNSHELTSAKQIKKLPNGCHSVKGCGRTSPDPADWVTLDDGVIIPCGKGTGSDHNTSSLLYNEFIVYDVAQIQIKYLVQMKFNHKSMW